MANDLMVWSECSEQTGYWKIDSEPMRESSWNEAVKHWSAVKCDIAPKLLGESHAKFSVLASPGCGYRLTDLSAGQLGSGHLAARSDDVTIDHFKTRAT